MLSMTIERKTRFTTIRANVTCESRERSCRLSGERARLVSPAPANTLSRGRPKAAGLRGRLRRGSRRIEMYRAWLRLGYALRFQLLHQLPARVGEDFLALLYALHDA